MVLFPLSLCGPSLPLTTLSLPIYTTKGCSSSPCPWQEFWETPEPWYSGSWKETKAYCLRTVKAPGEYSRGVISQVQEEADIPHSTILLKVGLKEPGCLHVHLVTQ